MKKLLSVFTIILSVFVFSACDPISTEATLNTNITQSTTDIPVTWIEITADHQEVCMGEQVVFTITIQPANATNQNYTISIDGNYLSFVGTSQLTVEVISEDVGGETMETIVTVTSDYDSNITDTEGIYIHHSSSPSCPVI